MTTEEAIKILDDGNWWDYLGCYIPKETRMELIDALDIADVALRAQQEWEYPEPLTLDQLREMDGEPVWIENASDPKLGRWEIVLGVEFRLQKLFCRENKTFWDYGNTWLAYRHKLKGGSKC